LIALVGESYKEKALQCYSIAWSLYPKPLQKQAFDGLEIQSPDHLPVLRAFSL
jgi:hypothetical protein